MTGLFVKKERQRAFVEKNDLKVFGLYYLRVGSRQIAVQFAGYLHEHGRVRLQVTDLETGQPIYKPSAAMLSKHSDNCWQRGTTFSGHCSCEKQLQAQLAQYERRKLFGQAYLH